MKQKHLAGEENTFKKRFKTFMLVQTPYITYHFHFVKVEQYCTVLLFCLIKKPQKQGSKVHSRDPGVVTAAIYMSVIVTLQPL